MNVYSYDYLCDAMRTREEVSIRAIVGDHTLTLRGLVNGLRPEDGSGRNWLVTIHDNGTNAEVYVRTA